MQFTFTFQVSGVGAALKPIIATFEHPEVILSSIGESLLRVNRARHENEQAPDGSKWKPLSPLTLLTKRKNRTLYDHGDLLRFFHQVEGDVLRLWTSDVKAEWHHFGTKPYTITPKKAKALKFGGMVRKRVNHPGLPSRPLIGFPDSDQALVRNVLNDHMRVLSGQ